MLARPDGHTLYYITRWFPDKGQGEKTVNRAMPGLITEQTFYFTTSKLLQNATTAFITIHDICYERQVAKLLTKIMQVFHDEMFDN